MEYRINLRKSAEKALRKLEPKYQKLVYEKLLELADAPRGHKCEKLSGTDTGYRMVAWPYRILYTIDDSDKSLDVYLIAHRKEAYR